MDKKQTLFLGIGFLLATPLANAQNTTDRKLVQGHRTEQLAKKYGEATSLKVRDNAVEKRLTPCLTTGKKHRKAVGNALVAKSYKSAPAVFDAGWSADFNTADQWEQFTVIDVNGDRAPSQYGESGTWNHSLHDGEGAAMYVYNIKNQADDWLITPGLNLKAGKSYYVNFKLRCVQNTYPERIEVKYGTDATVEAMTHTVLESTDVSNTEYKSYVQKIQPAEDGVFYIGFHAISDPFTIALYVDDISVTAAPEAKSPAMVTDVKVTPDASAALKATVEFKSPEKAFDGSALAALSGVKLMLNGKLVADVKTDKPGSINTVAVDDIPAAGINAFTLIPYNDEGDGESFTTSTYIGLDLPAAPENPILSDDPAKVVLSWDAAKAAHDGAFFPDDVVYHISSVTYNNYGEPELAEELAKTEKGVTNFDLGFGADEGDPREIELAVTAENATGISTSANISNAILLGKPEAVPYHESFAGGKESHVLIPFGEGQGVTFGMAGAGRSVDEAADEDGGSLYLQTFCNDSVGVKTFKISLAGTTHPMLAYKQMTSTKSGTFTVLAKAPGKEPVVLKKQEISEADDHWTTNWHDLSAFLGERYVQIIFTLTDMSDVKEQKMLYLDNIRIGDFAAKDLAVEVETDKKVKRNESTKVRVKVANVGSETVDTYKLKLYVNGSQVEVLKQDEPINALDVRVFEFDYKVDKLEEASELAIKAVVEADGDNMAGNNEAVKILLVEAPDLQPVRNLRAETIGENVVIAWDEPLALTAKTEGFEDYTPWEFYDFGEWTSFDGDEGLSAGDFVYDGNGNEIMYENQGEPFAYIVFNPHDFGGVDLTSGGINTFNAHGGNQFLASVHGTIMNIYTFDMETVDNDDWLISPALPGDAQTISFYANNVTATNQMTGELVDLKQKVEIRYSTSDTDINNFELLKTVEVAGGSWQEITADLPEGAKHFAIRNVTPAETAYILMIDDVTYHVGGGKPVKYNVYRDGKLLGSTSELAYTDEGTANGYYLYQVTAVYADDNESAPATLHSEPTGIGEIVSNGHKFDVYTIDGVRMKTQTNNMGGLKPGVYVVEGKKIVVK